MKSLLIAAIVSVAPPQKAPSCLTSSQLEHLTLFGLPPLLDAVAIHCGPSLPAKAYLLNGGRTLSRQLRADGASHWAGASSALSTIVGGKVPAGLTKETTSSFIGDLASTELVTQLKPEDCAHIDRLAGLLSPLPPSNLAGVAVTLVEIVADKDKKQPSARPILCPSPRQ